MNAAQIYQRSRTILGDSSAVKFSEAQLEAALCSVLALVNARVPRIVVLDLLQAAEEQTLGLITDLVVRDVLSVVCTDVDPSRSLAFRFEASQVNEIKIFEALPTEQELNWRVKLVTDHQIEGLDGAETSTIPTYCEMLLAYGVASRVLQMRNTQLAESANQASSKAQSIERMSIGFEGQFMQLLQAWQASQTAPGNVLPDGPGWQLMP